jgi:hypothetical protein
MFFTIPGRIKLSLVFLHKDCTPFGSIPHRLKCIEVYLLNVYLILLIVVYVSSYKKNKFWKYLTDSMYRVKRKTIFGNILLIVCIELKEKQFLQMCNAVDTNAGILEQSLGG